jgi:hypothetical protein
MGSRFVSLNGLHLPGNTAVEMVRRACTPLWMRNPDSSFPFSFRGSAFLYRVRGVSYCVFTRHQARGYALDDVSISLRDDSSIMQNAATYIGYHDDGTSERFDLCAMIVPPGTITRHMDRSVMFYEATEVPTDRNADKEHFFAFGYPSKLSRWECSEKTQTINLSQVRVDGEYVAQDENWYGLPGLKIDVGPVMGVECEGDFDGFSGGPVFSIHVDYRAVRFEGITMRASNSYLLFAPASWVGRLCDGSAYPSGSDEVVPQPPAWSPKAA